MDIYTVSKTCKNCGHVNIITQNKWEAAFDYYSKKYEIPCPLCGSTGISLMSNPLAPIDMDLLQAWAVNDDLYFLDQDEELILGEEKYVHLILDVIDHFTPILPGKKITLTEALCAIIYNNIHFDKDDQHTAYNIQLAERVKKELLSRQQLVTDAAPYIWPYIKEKVFPYLEIPFQ